MNDLPSFGELLKDFRKRRNFTQQYVASEIGVHRNAIGRWEQGDFLPERKAIVLELARVLQLDDQESRYFLEASFTALAPPWNVPYQRNPFFTGRRDSLDILHRRLTAEQTTARTQPYALYGLGGIGKTQLAVEYAYQHALDYTAVFWIAAESEESIKAGLLALADLLLLPESKDADQQRTIAAVQSWLTRQSRWLLIWDNLEDLGLLSTYLPTSHQGVVLLTTRQQALGTFSLGIELPTLSPQEGIFFLLRRARLLPAEANDTCMAQFAQLHPTEYATAETLVHLMGGLPLALDQAGAYIEETACGIQGYLQRYEQRRRVLLDRRGMAGKEHPQSVTHTIAMSYERLQQSHPAAAQLLLQCAFLQPDAIPEELLVTDMPGEDPIALSNDPDRLDQAIAILRTLSLVHRSAETRTLSIHRVVQAVLQEQLDAPTRQQWIEQTVHLVNARFPAGDRGENWIQCQRYLPQVENCAQLITQSRTQSKEAGQLLHRAGVYLRERGQYGQAEPLLVQALEMHQHTLGPEDLETGRCLSNLAVLYDFWGKYTEVEPLFRQALQILAGILGDEHVEVAECKNNLANYYWGRGKYIEAEQLHLRALQTREHMLGPDHVMVAESLYNLSLLYRTWGHYEKIEPLLKRAISIHEYTYGPEHPDTTIIFNNLALLYVEQGRYQEAEVICQRNLQSWEKHAKIFTSPIAVTLFTLGKLYAQQERCQEAEALFKQSLRIWEQWLAPEHLQLSHPCYELARLYLQRGQQAEAERLFLRALHIRESCLATDHPKVTEVLDGLTKMYIAQGKDQEAETLIRRLLYTREKQQETISIAPCN